MLSAVGERTPVMEAGAGPGFFKEYCPGVISTDVISTSWVNDVCDYRKCRRGPSSDTVSQY
jgi:hypothetical protein